MAQFAPPLRLTCAHASHTHTRESTRCRLRMSLKPAPESRDVPAYLHTAFIANRPLVGIAPHCPFMFWSLSSPAGGSGGVGGRCTCDGRHCQPPTTPTGRARKCAVRPQPYPPAAPQASGSGLTASFLKKKARISACFFGAGPGAVSSKRSLLSAHISAFMTSASRLTACGVALRRAENSDFTGGKRSDCRVGGGGQGSAAAGAPGQELRLTSGGCRRSLTRCRRLALVPETCKHEKSPHHHSPQPLPLLIHLPLTRPQSSTPPHNFPHPSTPRIPTVGAEGQGACVRGKGTAAVLSPGADVGRSDREREPCRALGGKKIALRGGGGGGTRKPIFPTPPSSLLGRRDGRGGGGSGRGRPTCRAGGGGQPNIYGSK